MGATSDGFHLQWLFLAIYFDVLLFSLKDKISVNK